MNGQTWTRIGTNSSNFLGSYDGGGYSISNLNFTMAENNVGLFGFIGIGGTVRNLALTGVNINTTGSYGDNVGGIAGQNRGTIENCYVTGAVTGRSSVGGIAGENRGTVRNCYSTCTVSLNNPSAINIGGIVGYNNGGWVTKCYATGNISGGGSVGGIVGRNTSGANSNVEGCVALNKEIRHTFGNTDISRVIGRSEGAMSNNYAREAGLTLYNQHGVVMNPIPTGATTVNGAHATAANTHGASSGTWWSGASNPAFAAANWSFANNRLPHLLTTTGGTFNQTQTVTVTP